MTYRYLMCVFVVAACGARTPHQVRAQRLFDRADYSAAEQAARRGIDSAQRDPHLWRIRIAAAARQGDAVRAADLYLRWHRLRRHYDPQALRELAAGTVWHSLSDERAAVRRRALRAVAAQRLRVLERAASQLLTDSDPMVALEASRVLMGRVPLAEDVVRRLVVSPNPKVRQGAIGVLAQHPRGSDYALFVTALGDSDGRVRRAAVSGLAGSRSAQSLLVARAVSDVDPRVRAQALTVLRGAQRGDIVAVANAALAHPYLGLRIAAFLLLVRNKALGLARARELMASSDLYLAVRAAVAFERAPKQERHGVLLRALAAKQWTIRTSAVNAIERIVAGTERRAMLERAALDDREEVRLAAARKLEALRFTGKASELYAATLASTRPEMRLQAARALMRLGDRSGANALGALAGSSVPSVRLGVARAYRAEGNVSLPIIHMLKDADMDVRLESAETLLYLLRRSARR